VSCGAAELCHTEPLLHLEGDESFAPPSALLAVQYAVNTYTFISPFSGTLSPCAVVQLFLDKLL
jgi:hypothetical protein